MNNVFVVSHKQRLDVLFDKANQLGTDPELLGHWARYLCVLVSGFIEESVRHIAIKYSGSKSSADIARFVGENLREFQNAKMNKILDLAGQFSADKKARLENATVGALKDAVDSVVANRHQIAHGKDVGISIATIRQYYDRVLRVLELLENEFAA